MTVYHHKGDIASRAFSPQNAFFPHQAKDWGYFQPGREDFRQSLQSAIPKLLANAQKTPKEELRELIATVRTVALRERLLKVWAKL